MNAPPRLSELQRAFAASLAGADAAALEPWIASRGIAPAARLRIYRNASHAIHVEALAVSYPAVRAFLGDECFDGVATRHAAWRGSRSGNLQDYGADFPAFLLEQPELAACPWIGEVAQLECMRQQSALSAASPPLDIDVLVAAIVADDDIRLHLQAHVRLFCASLPALDLWRYAQQPDVFADAPDPAGAAQHVLLWRAGGQVAMCELSSAQAAFTRVLMAGGTLRAALAATTDDGADAAIETLLRPLLEHALLSAANPDLPIENAHA